MNKDPQSDQDHVYYSITSVNNKSTPQPATFSVNRTDEILHTPSDWVVLIDEYKVPLFSVPLFQFKDNEYSVTLEWEGATVTIFLLYISSGAGVLSVSNSVYSYQNFLQSTNQALKTAYDALLLLKPLMPASEQPFMTLSSNNLITLNAESFYISSLPNPINIFLNKSLFNYFTNLPNFFLTNDKIQFLITDQFNNAYTRGGLNYFRMTQDTESISNWQQLNQLLIETSSIPVNKELIGASDDVQIQVISDYQIQPDANRPLPLFFKALGPIRVAELISDYPLRRIDLNLRWRSTAGNSDIILIEPNTSYTIKIVFVRKSYINAQDLNDEGISA